MVTTTIAQRIAAISTELSTVRDGELSALKTVLPEFSRLLNADVASVHGLSPLEDSVEVDFFYGHGFNQSAFLASYREMLRKAHRRVLLFDPSRPAPADCLLSRVIGFDERTPDSRWLLTRHGMGGINNLRTLICIDDSRLAWLGVGQEGPSSRLQRSLFRKVLPAFRRRVQLERWLQEAPPTMGLLHGVMDACGTPAYLLRGAAVVHANAEGSAALASDRHEVLQSLRATLGGKAADPDAPFKMVQYAGRGLPTYSLAVARQPSNKSGPRAAALAKRWQLTPRQSQVLALVAGGRSNKAIAATLGCKIGTVEFHITSLLDRSGCKGRAELIARIWSEAP